MKFNIVPVSKMKSCKYLGYGLSVSFDLVVFNVTFASLIRLSYRRRCDYCRFQAKCKGSWASCLPFQQKSPRANTLIGLVELFGRGEERRR